MYQEWYIEPTVQMWCNADDLNAYINYEKLMHLNQNHRVTKKFLLRDRMELTVISVMDERNIFQEHLKKYNVVQILIQKPLI